MCREPQLYADSTVRLHDIDPERVALVKAFCERFARARNVPMTFAEAPDLDAALEGADYVITTFRIGGEKSLILDETIPPRFGYFGDETAGPGGMFMAIRTVPVVVNVAKRMERLCPGAWILNYANPTNFITDAVGRVSSTRIVGLCDGYSGPPHNIGATLGLPPARITTLHAGFNHCSWVYRAAMDGRDLLVELRTADPGLIERNLSRMLPPYARLHRRGLELFHTYRLYPIPLGHVMHYFYHDDLLREQEASEKVYHTLNEEADRQRWNELRTVLREFDESVADGIARAQEDAHADLAIGVMGAIAEDTGALFPVNVPHRGVVQGIAPEAILEVYAVATQQGFRPIAVDPFPKSLLAHQNLLVTFQQLAVTGILEKSRDALWEALTIHPFTSSLASARELFDAMWKEEADVLGEYWT